MVRYGKKELLPGAILIRRVRAPFVGSVLIVTVTVLAIPGHPVT